MKNKSKINNINHTVRIIFNLKSNNYEYKKAECATKSQLLYMY